MVTIFNLIFTVLIIILVIAIIISLATTKINRANDEPLYTFGDSWNYELQFFSAVEEPEIQTASYAKLGDFQQFENNELIGGIQNEKW